jgi:shikimate 5-dehydrogenase
MLVNQASISFQLWFDVIPETKKVLEEIKSLKE